MLPTAGFCTNPVIHESKLSRSQTVRTGNVSFESSRCTAVLSRKDLQNSADCLCPLQLTEADLVGSTGKGVVLVAGRTFSELNDLLCCM